MVYTAVEIVFILIVAAFLGLVLGWLLRGKSIRERLESQWRRLVDDERNNLRQANEQLKRVKAENDSLAENTRGLEAKLDKLDALPGENRKLQQQLEEAQGQLATSAHLSGEHAELSAARDKLQARIDELAPLQGQNAELKTEIEAQQARIDALEPLQEETEDLRAKLKGAQAELDELRRLRVEAQQLRDTVESLRKSLAEAEARTSVSGGTPAPPPQQEPASESQGAPSAEDLNARVKHIAERTRGGEPAPEDDLKQIRGVGPVIERMLKEMGITSYRQIANFTNEDIDQVAAAMGSFRGRIQRDGWVEGARKEHRKKYGADA